MLLNKLKLSNYTRRILVVATGTAIGQAINILAIPVLTRLYTPAQFGTFSLYTTLVLFFGGICCLRYEVGITTSTSFRSAYHMMKLSMLTSLVFSLVLLGLIFFEANNISRLLGNDELTIWLYLLPFSVLITGIYFSIYYMLIRLSKPRTIAKSQVINNSVSNAGAIGSGLLYPFHSGGLILSRFLGLICSTINVAYVFFLSKKQNTFPRLAFKRMLKLGLLHRGSIYYLLPARAVNYAILLLPVAMLTISFGPKIAGFYTLSQKLLRIPTTMIASNVADIFRQEAALLYQKTGNFQPLFSFTYKKLLFSALLPIVFLAILAPELFGLVFGKGWEIAGYLARLMLLMVLGEYVVYPVSQSLIVLNKQYIDLILQLGLLLCALLALYIGKQIFDSYYYSVALFSVVFFLKYIIEFVVCYVLVSKSRRLN
jgi:O-antigen/teichoic acid export membrane protein